MTKSSRSSLRGLWAGALGSAAVLFAPQVFANCYEVYGPDHQLLYRSMRSPVDLSKQLHQTVPLVKSGATMVFTASGQGCEIEFNRLQPAVVELEGGGFKTIKPIDKAVDKAVSRPARVRG